MYCIVQNCRSVWRPNCNIKFLSFPKDIEKRNIWLSIVSIKGKFYSSAKICSLHFKPNSYDPGRPGHLLHNAVPFYSTHPCDCTTTTIEAVSTDPSTSVTHPNTGFGTVTADTMGIQMQHKSKENIVAMDAKYEPTSKRPCLKDFKVQMKMKSPRELFLEKNKLARTSGAPYRRELRRTRNCCSKKSIEKITDGSLL